MNQQDASRIKELGLDALKNPNPNLRKEALLELRQYDASIINDVLEDVIRKDRDKEVRDLAQNLLTKRQIQASLQPSKPTASSTAKSILNTNAEAWTCSFCGSQVTGQDRCPNCGAEGQKTNDAISTQVEVNQDTFLLYPKHIDFVKGKSKVLSRDGAVSLGCMSLFMSIFVIVGTLFLILVLRDTYEWFAISLNGVSGSAQYLDRRISSGDDSDTYYVSFQYQHNGRPYQHEQAVSREVYNRVEVGGSVPIVYASFNPWIAKVAGTNRAPIGMLLFVVVWNGIVYTLIYVAIRQYRVRKFLERHGKMLRGEIVESSQSTDSDGDLTLKVEYAFYVSETKKRLSKTESAQRNDLKGKGTPRSGTPVVVLYYNEQRYMLL